MKVHPAPLAMAGLWFTAALLSSTLHPHRYEAGRSRDPVATVKMNQSSLARILGEFRTGLSDMLFIKTERYLHGGVGYVPHLTEQLLSVQGTGQAVAHQAEEAEEDPDPPHEHAHGHGPETEDGLPPTDEEPFFHCPTGVETLIPTAPRDYRGWIGRMHRKVKPWRDPSKPHIHSSGKDLIPWFRMMTLSDPGYIRGYVLGAFWVERVSPEAALEFLEEGLRQNPEAFQLYLSKGLLLMRKARERHPERSLDHPLPDQLPLLQEAKVCFERAAARIARVRPPVPEHGEVTDSPDWNIYQENDARSAITLSLLFEERYGDPGRLPALRARYRSILPDHPRLQ